MTTAIKQKLMSLAESAHRRIFKEEMSNEMRKFLGNLSWSFFGGIIASGIMFVVNVFAGRILGPEEFGKYALVLSMANIFLIPMSLGIDVAVVHYLSKNKNFYRRKKYLNTSLFLKLVLIIITIFIFSSSYYFLGNILDKLLFIKSNIFYITLFFTIFLSLKNIFNSFIRGFYLFKFQSIVKIIEAGSIFSIFILTLFFSQKHSFLLIVTSIIFGYVLFILTVFVRLRKYFSFNFNFNYSKNIFTYGKYAAIGSVAGVLLSSFDKIFINKYLGVTSLGIYNAYSTASILIISQLVVIFVNVFFPMLSSVKSVKVIKKKINKIFKLVFLPASILMSLLIYVIMFMFGKNYPIDYWLIFEFSILSILWFYFGVLMWLIASRNQAGIKFTSFHSIISGIILFSLIIIFRNIFNLHLAVGFLIVAIVYGIIMANWNYKYA